MEEKGKYSARNAVEPTRSRVLGRITLYVQPERHEGVIMLCPIELRDAIALLDLVKVSPPEVDIPAMVGFDDPDRDRFIEITPLGGGKYHIRYEDGPRNIEYMEIHSREETVNCLIDFFSGKPPRYCMR